MSLPLWKEDFMKKVEEDAKNNDMTIPHAFEKIRTDIQSKLSKIDNKELYRTISE